MIVNCVAYQGGKRLAPIPVDAVAAHLGREDCFVWVALKDPEPAELEQFGAAFGLDEMTLEEARADHPRPKIEERRGLIVVVLHLVDLVDGELHVGEVTLFVGRGFTLSVRRDSPQTFTTVRERSEEEPELLRRGAAFVLYAIMDTVVERCFPVIDALEDQVEAVEEAILARDGTRAAIEELHALKRRLYVFRHAVAPLMSDIGKLYGGRVPAACHDMQDYFRDIFDHLSRLDARIADLREAIADAVDLNFSLTALETNAVNRRLAAWAGIFAASTALAGVWGMNFEHMPELKWAWGYPAALGVIVGVCGLLWWRFRRAGWL